MRVHTFKNKQEQKTTSALYGYLPSEYQPTYYYSLTITQQFRALNLNLCISLSRFKTKLFCCFMILATCYIVKLIYKTVIKMLHIYNKCDQCSSATVKSFQIQQQRCFSEFHMSGERKCKTHLKGCFGLSSKKKLKSYSFYKPVQ